LSGISLSKVADEALGALDTAASRGMDLFQPTLRLGVTGLSRAGKTVFITSLIHNLINAGRLPLFKAHHEGRISNSYLRPQPDDDVPRFGYEDHVKNLINDRIWPESTRSISQLRLTIEYETASGWGKLFRPGSLNLDIVDYPGEWLLDLPLLSQDFETFSNNAIELARSDIRSDLSAKWIDQLAKIDPQAPFDDVINNEISAEFAQYLRNCKTDRRALSTLPPGRLLLPGDLEGSPAVTFTPLLNIEGKTPTPDSYHAIMTRRFESYKSKVIRPFYQNHFARIDRQIILIDALQALNAGPESLLDLERALDDILQSFNIGRNSFPSNLFSRRIDKILIAATKADHLHHESHDRLERIVQKLVARSKERINLKGADIDVIAMAAVRATVEGNQKQNGELLPLIIGTPKSGETIGDEVFDGKSKKAIFPGDLPEDPDSIFQALESNSKQGFEAVSDLNFVRFRPQEIKQPKITTDGNQLKVSLPHIRLDRAMEFLIGDKLL
jgi:predicted YcjX-like family ATPase